jgi:hypothetical protein
MKRFILTLLIATTIAGVANAQRRSTVSGVVADAETHQGLIGVVVEVTSVADSTKSTAIVSGVGGSFSAGIDRGEYNVRASLLGYEPLRRTETFTEGRHTLDTLYLTQGVMIDAVVTKAVALRTSLRSDTVIYNADSYKVTADADVASLLQKMPGITVNGSTVEAQGETIRKVLLDGKEFFGEDVGAAISSIPAEAIKGVELFDKLSDNAEFTGIDDGESYKTLNLVTREAMRTMITGKVNGLYGIEAPKYSGDTWHHYGLLGGNINILRGESRLTIGGNLNNINERSFTFNDPLGMGDDDVAKVGRFQLSYRNLLGKKKTWDVNATYTFNITDAYTERSTDRTYYTSDDPLHPIPWTSYTSASDQTNINRGHNFNTRIDFKPNEYNQLMIRAGANYQGNNSSNNSLENYFPVGGGDVVGLDNWSRSKASNFSSNLMAMYSVRLGKKGRTLMVIANGNYGPRSGDSESYSERPDMDPRWQLIPSDNLNYSVGGGVVYTEPIGQNSLISLDYNFGYNYSDNDRKSYLRDPITEILSPEPDAALSGVYTNTRTTHRVGPRYSLTKGGTTFVAGVMYQYMVNEVDRVLPQPLNMSADFNNLTYNMMLRSKVSSNSNLRIDVRSMMNNPSVTDLQDIPDISNSSNITRGNPNLSSSYTNSFTANYNISMPTSGRTLSFNLGGSQTTGSIVRRTLINSEGFLVYNPEGAVVDTLDAVGRYAEPLNMNGSWNARAGIGFGFPVGFIGSNVNLNAGVSYSETPSQIGSWSPGMTEPQYTTNFRNTVSPYARIYIGSNISENVDFGINYNISYNNARNTFSTNSNNETLNQRLRVNYKFIFPKSFTFSGNFSYTFDKSLTRANNDNEFFIVNLSIGKKVFRNRLGEVNLFVNNLFDRNDSFRRTYAEDYFQNAIRSTIGRYFGVSFTWNIRSFNGKTASSVPEEGRGRGDWQGGPGGPPPGGFNGPPMGGGGMPPMGGGGRPF